MKTFFSIIASVMMFTAPVFAKEVKDLPEIKQIFSLKDIEVGQSEPLISGSLEDVAVLCEKGVEFPLRYVANLGLISIDVAPSLKIKFEKTCYVRVVGSKVYISEDLITWEKPSLPFGKSKLLAGFTADKSELRIEADVKVEEYDDEDDDFDWDD